MMKSLAMKLINTSTQYWHKYVSPSHREPYTTMEGEWRNGKGWCAPKTMIEIKEKREYGMHALNVCVESCLE